MIEKALESSPNSYKDPGKVGYSINFDKILKSFYYV